MLQEEIIDLLHYSLARGFVILFIFRSMFASYLPIIFLPIRISVLLCDSMIFKFDEFFLAVEAGRGVVAISLKD